MSIVLPSQLLIPRVFGDPRSCQMDGHVISTIKVLDPVVIPARRHPDRESGHTSDGFVSHGQREIYKPVDLLLGVSRSIIILRTAVRNHGDGMWAMPVCCDSGKTRFTLIDHPDDYIRMTHADYPDVLWSGCIMKVVRISMLCSVVCSSLNQEKLKRLLPFLEAQPFFFRAFICRLRLFVLAFVGALGVTVGVESRFSFLGWVYWWFLVQFWPKNVFKEENCFICAIGDAHEKSTDKLSVKEFRDRFCIPNGVIVDFLRGEDVVPTEKAEQGAIIFSKEQFNAGLRFPLPALFIEFLHFTQIPPVFIHPNIIRVLMGCSIINMLYNLDLTMLEVFFVYLLKKAKTDIFSLSAHLPSLQLVTELPDSTKEGAKGRVMVRGGKKGPPRGLGGKGVFCCLSKLFEIDAKERQCKTC
ncbi:hypothetical protein CK203_016545 [Vitis vinifera]|uniref:Uncharacterized protein n=1 Tax=Vitis vinifera TaxID=29760 RepID=A0A438J112_VITVI|nr:hypothetical protein CK203_016545 [Vitis vinifera]